MSPHYLGVSPAEPHGSLVAYWCWDAATITEKGGGGAAIQAVYAHKGDLSLKYTLFHKIMYLQIREPQIGL